MNRYSQFDIDAAGAVINNARKDSATLTGGVVAGNPHLAKGEAGLIVNQVLSHNPSHLQGMVEIAGQKADVIMANPSGIQINGGFINAGKVQYTAGKVAIEQGRPVQHSAPDGFIEIAPGGLNGQIRAGAGQVDLITGNNTLGADGSITAKRADGQHAAPRFAVDSSALGGMYAGRIRLIGTEQGVGVHHAGTIRADSLSIKLPGALENSGSISAGAFDIQLGGLRNDGELRHNSNNTLYLHSTSFTNRDNATLQARTAGQDKTDKNTPETPNGTGDKNSGAIDRIIAWRPDV